MLSHARHIEVTGGGGIEPGSSSGRRPVSLPLHRLPVRQMAGVVETRVDILLYPSVVREHSPHGLRAEGTGAALDGHYGWRC